MEEYKLFASDS